MLILAIVVAFTVGIITGVTVTVRSMPRLVGRMTRGEKLAFARIAAAYDREDVK